MVGDCPTTPVLLALVAAAREAMVNAARHSGAPTVSLYAEVGADGVEVFVRDRGCGFAPDGVPADRFGLTQSVVGRMERHGGRAVVRSAVGEGTEVRLEVSRLARTQERELRGWLYTPAPAQELAFAGALEQVAAEVEEAHGVTVDTVVVGDCPTTPSLHAAVAATREALSNAARHSGATTVSLYAEVAADRVEVFVRDRGCGFAPDGVPADRFGLSQSVVGRMERHGGRAVVRSAVGEGTEVRLEVSRA